MSGPSLDGDTLTLEGQPIKIIGLTGPTPDRTVLWIPALRTVLGGIPIVAAMKKCYPNLAGESSLELSAKVAKGEMQWP
ncbi:hypothetical protein D3C71_1739200 [compost metagenome]